jgi:hypothetical protein
MSGRRIRRLLMLAVIVGVAYWIYKDQPTVSGLVDSVVAPLMGSHAAVKSSERNRLTGDATAAINEQSSDAGVGTLHEGMTAREVRELLGNPEKIETEKRKPEDKGPERERWTYGQIGRVLVFEQGRVVSIILK